MLLNISFIEAFFANIHGLAMIRTNEYKTQFTPLPSFSIFIPFEKNLPALTCGVAIDVPVRLELDVIVVDKHGRAELETWIEDGVPCQGIR